MFFPITFLSQSSVEKLCSCVDIEREDPEKRCLGFVIWPGNDFSLNGITSYIVPSEKSR